MLLTRLQTIPRDFLAYKQPRHCCGVKLHDIDNYSTTVCAQCIPYELIRYCAETILAITVYEASRQGNQLLMQVQR